MCRQVDSHRGNRGNREKRREEREELKFIKGLIPEVINIVLTNIGQFSYTICMKYYISEDGYAGCKNSNIARGRSI